MWQLRTLRCWVTLRDIRNPTSKVHELLQVFMCFYANILISYFASPKLYSILNRLSLVTFTLRIAPKCPAIIVVISHLKKWHWAYNKTLLDVWNQCWIQILRKTLILQLLYHGRVCLFSFFIITSSVLIIFVIMLKYDVFKLSIYLNIYFFFLHRNFDRPKCWGISFKDSKFIQVITLRWL